MNSYIFESICFQCGLSQATLFPSSLGERLLELIFAGYVPLASQSPYPILFSSVANYRPHLYHFWASM